MCDGLRPRIGALSMIFPCIRNNDTRWRQFNGRLGAIRAIQAGARDNAQQVDAAAEAVIETSAMARGSGEALRDIVRLVSETSAQVRSIALGAEEQSTALREVTEAVSEISRVAALTSEGMDDSGQAVRAVMDMTGRLKGLIDSMAGRNQAALT